MNTFGCRITTALVACILLAVTQPALAKKEKPPETSHDGLELVQGSKVDIAYLLPDADMSGYSKVMLLEPYIAFKKNWKRDHNRASLNRVSDKDMARMIERGKDLFTHVFSDALEEGGYPVVHEVGEDVLLVRPAIINLDVTAPDVSTSARSRTYTASAGESTLFIELYDSVTGQILVRAFDRKVDRDTSMRWTMSRNRATNTQDATRALRHWAGQLVKALDRSKKNKME